MKILLVWDELFHADRRTDRHGKAISRFFFSSEAPKDNDRQQQMSVLSSDNNYYETHSCTKFI